MSLMEDVKNYPLNTKVPVTVKEETVSDEAFQKIQTLLSENYYRGLPGNFSRIFGDIKERVYDMNLSGKFPTRIEQYYYKSWSQKMTPLHKEQIGNIASQSIVAESSFLASIVDHVDWGQGDFGDTGSCYWRENQYAVDVLLDQDFRALKLYTPDEKPLARCWILWDTNEQPVIFNSYGIDLPLMASVVSKLFDCKQRIIILRNNGQNTRLLYINSSSGCVFYKNQYQGDPSTVDLGIDVEWHINNHRCSHCEKIIEWSNIWFLNNDLHIYCQKCYEDKGGDKY